MTCCFVENVDNGEVDRFFLSWDVTILMDVNDGTVCCMVVIVLCSR